MAAEVSTEGPTFIARPARKLFPLDIPENVAPYPTDYAVSADGQRILVNTIVEQPVEPAAPGALEGADGIGGREHHRRASAARTRRTLPRDGR